MKYIVDTNIINRLVDGTIGMEELPTDGTFVASHIQIDEINRTKNQERMKVPRNMVVNGAVAVFIFSLLPMVAHALGDSDPVIVLVHGRGHSGRDSKVVENEIVQSFRDAEQKLIGEHLVSRNRIAFVWYADLLDDGLSPPPVSVSCSGASDDHEQKKWLEDLRSSQIAIAESLHLDSNDLRELTSDTYKYLSNGQTRCEVDARLQITLDSNKFSKHPIILIAHSLGGVVAFASLQKISQFSSIDRPSIARFITVGTQVGDPLVLRGINGSYIEPPIPLPIVIESWTNFRNKDDLLAFETKDRFKSTDQARLPRDVSIDQSGDDRHAFKTYIANDTVITTILNSWCQAYGQNDGKPTKCAEIEKMARNNPQLSDQTLHSMGPRKSVAIPHFER